MMGVRGTDGLDLVPSKMKMKVKMRFQNALRWSITWWANYWVDIAIARHIIGCRLIREMRLWNALDDVAGYICLFLLCTGAWKTWLATS